MEEWIISPLTGSSKMSNNAFRIGGKNLTIPGPKSNQEGKSKGFLGKWYFLCKFYKTIGQN